MKETTKAPELFSEALARYRNTRERIYRELEIKHVQKAVRNKILKMNDSSVELLFHRDEIDTDMFITDDTAGELGSASEHSDLVCSEASEEPKRCPSKRIKMCDNSVSKYLSLEAEYSGEEEEEGSDGEDLESLIDDSCDDSIELSKFVQERLERDGAVLRSLRRRFAGLERRPPSDRAEVVVNGVQPDSSEEFPEIQEMVLDAEEDHQQETHGRSMDLVCERGVFFRDEALFNDESSALEKLSRKEEEKSTGFFEQRNV